MAFVLTTGCGGPGVSMKGESGLLPKPGARIVLNEVKNVSGQIFDVDVEGLLRGAMLTALQGEQLEWTSGSSSHRFTLDLDILEYRPGNAFQRWLLPGYGSTVLGVRGSLKDAQSGAVAAEFVHERSVYFGGAYTIGAWSYVFDEVAEDIAEDLKVRIEQGGQFIVYLKPRADQAAAQQPSEREVKIKLDSVSDDRREQRRIGFREAAFGVSMGDVHLAQKPADLLQRALRDDLMAAGYRIVESGQDLSVESHLRKFWVHTDTTPLYWDVIGEIEFEVIVRPAVQMQERLSKTFTCRESERTYVWPSAAILGNVLDSCLADMMLKARADNIWRQAGK
ncbi:YajG family lipoprotein [Petrachloros mirabilis]